MIDSSDNAPPPIPRRWEAPCPNCGAVVPFASSTTPYAVCSYCRSTVVREGEVLRRIGESAELIDSRSRLQLGTSGVQDRRAFTLVGRVQYGYGEGVASLDGTWTEWHALFDDGRSGWLSEDNDQYVIAFDRDDSGGAPPFGALEVGQSLRLADSDWRVASIVRARAIAAEGELPTRPALDSAHPIVDLRNAHNQVATLDYLDERAPTLAIGNPVRLAELALQGLVDGPDLGLATVGGRSFDCPSCGAACAPKREDTQSMSCTSCFALIDLSKGVGADLTAFQQRQRVQPKIALGTVGRLGFGAHKPVEWQVIGFSVKTANSGSDGSFAWRDYLLHNVGEGFAFLIDSDDGWVGYRTMTGVPEQGRNARTVRWKNAPYVQVDAYRAQVSYVEGEFYWAVRRDDSVLTTDFNGVGAMSARRLSKESTDSEVVWSEGSIIPADAVRKAFRLSAPKTVPSFAPYVSDGIGPLSDDIGPLSDGSGSLIKYALIVAAILIFLFVLNDNQRGMVLRAASDGYIYTGGGHK
ncbi:DUF4178 domain-containing protein [Nevskia sp.]|uniref:DUF4178 domain-containing protein n=1 Tax=Nevskia sp. TaxID=1929292 RepID=UPI0025F1CBB0|nr:DUF4178 domain-containing protein [Nevskia sp.]